ncbi:hypothetical protein AB0B66_10785 [Catellatospora sp. NPDC049111]|uniref:hypothetical protein n=1 Tax=Catellatospora sp. NPDC049111 TaxID=3155271 RepID=UPI0033ED6076
MNRDDPQAWSRHLTMPDATASTAWADRDLQDPVPRPGVSTSAARLIAGVWPSSGEPRVIAAVTGQRSIADTTRLARRWGVRPWPSDLDEMDFPKVTAVRLYVDAEAIRLVVGRMTWAWARRPAGWQVETGCTLGLIAIAPETGLVADEEIDWKFQAAIGTGAAYFGDISVVDLT